MATADDLDLAAGRDCGGCLACCQVFLIDDPELQKPAGAMCGHAARGGCAIHATRPQTCRAFFCTWRQVEALPDSARPDRLGVMFWTTGMARRQTLFDNVGLIAAAVDDDPAVFETPAVRQVLSQLSHGALPIFVRWGDMQQLVHPAPDLADAILNPATTPHKHLVEAGRAWLARYAPFARRHTGDKAVLPPGY